MRRFQINSLAGAVVRIAAAGRADIDDGKGLTAVGFVVANKTTAGQTQTSDSSQDSHGLDIDLDGQGFRLV